MPASSAATISSCRLPTPEKTTLRGSPPACSTRKSSPPETMSKPRPSRASNASRARFGADFTAKQARTMSARTRRLIGLERDRQKQAHRVRDGGALTRGYVAEAVERHEHAVGQPGVELVGRVVCDADVELEPERPGLAGRVFRVPGL